MNGASAGGSLSLSSLPFCLSLPEPSSAHPAETGRARRLETVDSGFDEACYQLPAARTSAMPTRDTVRLNFLLSKERKQKDSTSAAVNRSSAQVHEPHQSLLWQLWLRQCRTTRPDKQNHYFCLQSGCYCRLLDLVLLKLSFQYKSPIIYRYIGFL